MDLINDDIRFEKMYKMNYKILEPLMLDSIAK